MVGLRDGGTVVKRSLLQDIVVIKTLKFAWQSRAVLVVLLSK